MEATTSKKELIDWISNLEDEKTLLELAVIKRKATFNFDEEFKKGITGEELKKRLSERLKSLPWKK
jgi:regulator of replication initiation timing